MSLTDALEENQIKAKQQLGAFPSSVLHLLFNNYVLSRHFHNSRSVKAETSETLK